MSVNSNLNVASLIVFGVTDRSVGRPPKEVSAVGGIRRLSVVRIGDDVVSEGREEAKEENIDDFRPGILGPRSDALLLSLTQPDCKYRASPSL